MLATRARTSTDRLVAALPLTGIYVVLCSVYLVEAWRRATIWLFTDELETTQLSRSIAATGHAARRGVAHSSDGIYSYVTAPMWLFHNVATGYAGVKYLDVFLMTSVVFPTYLLARMIVGRKAALFAAAGAATIPSLAYTSYIVQENVAYPYAALCFFLIAKALVTRRRSWIWVAIGASALAPEVRGELIVIPIVFAFAAVFAIWSSAWAHERRRSWSTGDWIGVVALGAGAAIVISALLSRNSAEWYEISTSWKHRAFVLGDWAAGSLGIGLGMVPLIAGLASLFRAPGEQASRELRMVRCVMVGAFVSFGLYTGMKAAYLANHFATRVEERNIIYIAPLLFIGTALVFERRRVNVLALLGATAYAFYLVAGTPFFMDRQLYSDALGLAILEQANRYLVWTPQFAQWLLLGIVVGSTIWLLALRRLADRGRVAGALAATLAVGVLGWSLTGEIAAAAGTNSLGVAAAATLRHPFQWVDNIAHGQPTIYLAQGVGDQGPEWLLEFWNRSIVTVSSPDGTLGGPGPAGGPNITTSGKLYWTLDPLKPGREYAYAVEDWPCIDLAGTFRGKHYYKAGGGFASWKLIQLAQPNRLNAICSGIYPGGWTGPNDSEYFRFGAGSQGWMRIVVSRRDWGGNTGPSPFHVYMGPLVENAYNQPQIASVERERKGTIDSFQTKVYWMRTIGPRFAVKVVVDKKFVPHTYDPGLSDTRTLGAEVTYTFFKNRPSATLHK